MINFLLQINNNKKEIAFITLGDNNKKNGIINGQKINNLHIYLPKMSLLDEEFKKLTKVIDDEIDSDDDNGTDNCLKKINHFKNNILVKYQKYLNQDEFRKYLEYLKKYGIIINEKRDLKKFIKKGR